MEEKGKILIVDDNEDVLLSLNMLLKKHVEGVRVLTNPERITQFMDTFNPDVILLDMNFRLDAISGEEGYQWLDTILKKDPNAVVLFITAYVDTAKAVRAIKAGAIDFIPKPWDNDKLLDIVKSAVKLSHKRHNPGLYDSSLDKEASGVRGVGVESGEKSTENGPLLLGECESIRILREQILRVAPTDANVLITGENGTGKDVVANLLHHYSNRADKAYVTIDLGTIPEQLFESELFGYEKGAFTDARSSKAGRIETADKGTVFLDEIGNLTSSAQQKLLTLIEKRQLSALGSNKIKKVNVRLLTATNANLPQMVVEGKFRQDLLYRINTIELHLTPLRERGNDIILLAEYFAQKIARRYNKAQPSLSDKAKEKLLSHSWPGNVRELQHVIERAIVLSQGNILNERDIAFSASPTKESNNNEENLSDNLNLENLERQAIMRAIERSNGNLSNAASLLGITRYALYRKIEKYSLN